ncbi:MAG: ABC transporter substrate-binding protein [Pigmentiphaga sp.]
MLLRIDVHPDPMMGLLPMFAAIEAGLFKKRGIATRFVARTAVQAVEQMRNNEMDLSFSGFTFTIMAKERFGLATKFISAGALRGDFAGKSADFMNVLAAKHVKIEKPSDFEGKRLAVFALDGGITHCAPVYLFRKLGLDASSMHWKTIPSA